MQLLMFSFANKWRGPSVYQVVNATTRGGIEAWRTETCKANSLAIAPSTRNNYEQAVCQFEE